MSRHLDELHRTVCLGKRAPKIDDRTLRLARYLAPSKFPSAVDYGKAVPEGAWGMLANDRLGDCTCAAQGHAIQAWTANASMREAQITDDQVIASYERLGYRPGDESTDQGATCIDALNDWRTNGLGGHRILAYAQADPYNHNRIRQAIATFGGVYVGINLPLSAQGQRVWTRSRGPRAEAGSWGGHAVWVVGYTSRRYKLVTWGYEGEMTHGFFERYCDEAYAVLSEEWLNAAGKSPSGLDIGSLQSDLASVTR